MNSYFEQGGFYGQGGAASGPDYRFSIGLGGLGGVTAAYGQHQPPRAPQDPVSAVGGYDAPGSPSKSSLYSSLSDPSPYRHGGESRPLLELSVCVEGGGVSLYTDKLFRHVKLNLLGPPIDSRSYNIMKIWFFKFI